MKFEDEEVENLDLANISDVLQLIIKYLCGEEYERRRLFKDDGSPKDDISDEDKRLLELLPNLLHNAKKNGLSYEQFNEFLLLLNQDRVGEDFFKFFFKKGIIPLDDLKEGIRKFRGFAMLRFGNFRFAYKQLIQKSENELKEISKLVEEEFTERPPKMLEIEEIGREKIGYLGEISAGKIDREVKSLDWEIEHPSDNLSSTASELRQFKKGLSQMSKDLEEAKRKALKNTDIYLTWDYMNIYIATSMRNKWEFEETFDFIRKVFDDTRLKKLNLRYFDPTQSKCGNPRDKGLIEGLMLKRALCTIYLAQESDTMGKDSELAATLAQSKPVIAYLPQYKPQEYSKKIKGYPLDFFKKRLLILDAEEIFDQPVCIKKLRRFIPDFEEKIDHFLGELDKYRHTQPFTLYTEKEAEFKRNYNDFPKICQILAIAECYNFDRRADLLKERHPLSMQVDLQSGVANGVLVVRSYEKCAELLHRILTNNMQFTIKHNNEGLTVLEENISGSPFRVVTDYERLTNSFWNLFIRP